jgi:hypothetical protein
MEQYGLQAWEMFVFRLENDPHNIRTHFIGECAVYFSNDSGISVCKKVLEQT